MIGATVVGVRVMHGAIIPRVGVARAGSIALGRVGRILSVSVSGVFGRRSMRLDGSRFHGACIFIPRFTATSRTGRRTMCT